MSDNQEQHKQQRTVQIRQQNTNKSMISQLDLLQSLRQDDYDICLIQEPYIDFRGKTRANRNWIAVYLSTHNNHPDSTRSVILVNATLITDSWKQIHFDHPDITAIEIQGQFSTLHIINVYNDCKNNSSLTHLSAYMRDQEKQQCENSPLNTLWMGDFN
jgi:endonuclease/exonuclease/phosphatase family metal-dependent hydrolase